MVIIIKLMRSSYQLILNNNKKEQKKEKLFHWAVILKWVGTSGNCWEQCIKYLVLFCIRKRA